MKQIPSALIPAAAAILVLLSDAALRAQTVTITLEPSRTEIPACAGETLEVAVRISNPGQVDVGGYQAFLRFPAKYLAPVRYESDVIDGFVEIAGPIPFGAGYRACNAPGADGWGDGAGDDVVAVAATVFAAGSSTPFRETSAELGRFIFRPTGELPPGPIALESNLEACHRPLEQTSRAFGPDGSTLGEASSSSFTVAMSAAGPAVSDLVCIDQTQTVLLRWFNPPLDQFGGFRIYRNDDLIARISVNFLTSYEDREPGNGSLTYRVSLVDREGVESCGVTCSIDRGARFRRGDANRDARVNVSDPIAILDYLFRGGTLTCQDAADFDDNGEDNITDAIAILRHLFEPGEKPSVPPPFATEGLDPTSDDLTCEE